LSFSQHFDEIACSALIIYDNHKKDVVYQDFEYVKLDLPYVPGFLAFRELPALLELFKRLKNNKPQFWPQVIFVDGNGIIHQNQCGLACHLGIVLDTPTVGCGKTFFYVDGLSKEGIYKTCDESLFKPGDSVFLKGKSGRTWAAAVKSSTTSNDPLFVSVGHKISLPTAVECIVSTCKFRIP
jgi:deoxyinosine 3'endonuclease (endonuclease V)